MSTDKNCLAVIGGDDREVVLVKSLTDRGYSIKVFGLSASLMPLSVQVCSSFQEAVENVDVVILPLPGINNKGILYAKLFPHDICLTPEDFAYISPNVPVFVGAASQYLKNIAQTKRISLIEVGDLDEVAIPNSVPSAEGAIQIAMEKLPITIHGSESFVIGYGRVAETLCTMLKGIGAKVTVFARNSSQLAKCQVLGYQAKELKYLSQYVNQADVIFNSVPALVIDEEVLIKTRKDTLIIDLASIPGGTNFEAAKKLGVSALLAPGLPGKVAPLTAGKILAEAYPRIIDSYYQRT
ncbi:MAG: dipicolinate synthase subunit DpsA [Bacillota bacterium]